MQIGNNDCRGGVAPPVFYTLYTAYPQDIAPFCLKKHKPKNFFKKVKKTSKKVLTKGSGCGNIIGHLCERVCKTEP